MYESASVSRWSVSQLYFDLKCSLHYVLVFVINEKMLHLSAFRKYCKYFYKLFCTCRIGFIISSVASMSADGDAAEENKYRDVPGSTGQLHPTHYFTKDGGSVVSATEVGQFCPWNECIRSDSPR